MTDYKSFLQRSFGTHEIPKGYNDLKTIPQMVRSGEIPLKGLERKKMPF